MRMGCLRELVLNYGKMVMSMLVNSKLDIESSVSEMHIMVKCTLEPTHKGNVKVLVTIYGQVGIVTQESGRITNFTEKEPICLHQGKKRKQFMRMVKLRQQYTTCQPQEKNSN